MPLHIASKWGHVEMVKLLVDNTCNLHGDTKVRCFSVLITLTLLKDRSKLSLNNVNHGILLVLN